MDDTTSRAIIDARGAEESAALIDVNDREPANIRRKRVKGWNYCTVAGKTIREKGAIERIKGMAIPPAYTDVTTCRANICCDISTAMLSAMT